MDKDINILMLEDSAIDAELIIRELRKGGITFSLRRVQTKETFIKELENFSPRIILADYNLPTFDGISALEIVKEKFSEIPFIFISGVMGEEFAIETLKKGATDYILKGKLSKLVPAVQRALHEAEEYKKRMIAEKDLAEQLKIVNNINTLLRLFVQASSRMEYLDEVVDLISKWSGCRCAGIRVLNEHGEIPYESYTGFSKEFWEAENWLSIKSDQCACVRVVKGEFEPQDASMVSRGRSFCCSDIFSFIEGLSEEERARFRGKCYENGFATVVLIPIRYRDEIIGLIHLADESKDKVAMRSVEFIESVSPVIGEAVKRFSLEDALRRSHDELEIMVEERTADLAMVNDDLVKEIAERKKAEEEIRKLNEKLEHHILELETANKELESFCSAVSHDLKTPLVSVDGYCQLLLEEYGDKVHGEVKDTISSICMATNRMVQMVEDMLKLSQVIYVDMQCEKVNLSELANQISKELRRTQPERNVEFTIMPNLILNGDGRLLKIALENLINNAWKFTNKKPEARMEFGATKHGEKSVYFLRDNGAGFDMAYADKLFKPFQRLHPTSEFSGNGIGLATVQRIIQRHGGSIWAEAEAGDGATFYFTL